MNDIGHLASANDRLASAASVLEALNQLTMAEWLIAVQHVDQKPETEHVWATPIGTMTPIHHVKPEQA